MNDDFRLEGFVDCRAYKVGDLVPYITIQRPKWWQFWRRPEMVTRYYRCTSAITARASPET